MIEIRATQFLNAPKVAVWSALTDFPSYAAWNPFITRISGEAAIGGRLEVSLHLGSRDPVTFHPVLTEAAPERRLAWRGRIVLPTALVGFPGLSIVNHGLFALDVADGSVRLLNQQSIEGTAASLIGADEIATLRQSLSAMNEALRRRLERGPAQPAKDGGRTVRA